MTTNQPPKDILSLPYREEELFVIESNIDDMNPEFFPHVIEILFEHGAKDCWITPIIMKFGRPAQCLSVLSDPEKLEALTRIIFRETTTIGVRVQSVARLSLERETVEVVTPHGSVKVKAARDRSGQLLNALPELRDCQQIAKARNMPLKEVYRSAELAFSRGDLPKK